MLRQVIIHSLTKSNATTALLNKCSAIHNHKCMLPLIQNLHRSNITSNHKHVTEQPQILTEEEYLMKTKAHPDVFGAAFKEEAQGDEGDKEEEAYFEDQPLPAQKLRTKQYADMIKELIRMRKIQEAIDVMEVRMIKQDRVKPEGYIYNLLMGACGRVGYTKKAFSLFNRMKQRGLSPMGGTYTALFNACANSPWQADGLSRATHLRNVMLEKGHEANPTTYNAMIKAFGRCGDLKTAFELVDEMVEKKLPTLENTFNFLLQASITDRDAGFRHALLVWRKMVAKNIRPTLYSYNLMLRCVRDCGLGDVEITKDVINRIVGTDNVAYLSGESGTELLGSCDSEKQLQMPPTQITEINQPNLLAKRPHLGSIVSIAEITKAEDRLLVVGGLTGFLNDLAQNDCNPDVKTFTLLLDCIPSTLPAENELLGAMKKYKVKPDVDFCNMLIKKRSMRFDYENAKAVVNMLKKMNKLPNLMTYGVLALSCQTKQEAMELIEEMLQKKYRLNTQILGTLLHNACHHTNFLYVLEIMELCLAEEVKPDKRFMDSLEEFRRKCKRISNDKDDKLHHSVTFKNGFKAFRNRYKNWLNEVEIDDTQDEHPWHQYRIKVDTDVRHYKDKEADSHFKPIHRSLFKQKTSPKYQKVERKKNTKSIVTQ